MKNSSEMIRAEIGYMKRIMDTACAVESALGEPADPHDTRVQMRAAEMILAGEGVRMRNSVEEEIHPNGPMLPG
jgi:hypothetical protein